MMRYVDNEHEHVDLLLETEYMTLCTTYTLTNHTIYSLHYFKPCTQYYSNTQL